MKFARVGNRLVIIDATGKVVKDVTSVGERDVLTISRDGQAATLARADGANIIYTRPDPDKAGWRATRLPRPSPTAAPAAPPPTAKPGPTTVGRFQIRIGKKGHEVNVGGKWLSIADLEARVRLNEPEAIEAYAAFLAHVNRIPYEVFRDLLFAESGMRHVDDAGNVKVNPESGARGIGQLMPGTARELGVDPSDIVGNLQGSATYLARQLARFGDIEKAAAAYNAGPARLQRALREGGTNWRAALPVETQVYLNRIFGGGPTEIEALADPFLDLPGFGLPPPTPLDVLGAISPFIAAAAGFATGQQGQRLGAAQNLLSTILGGADIARQYAQIAAGVVPGLEFAPGFQPGGPAEALAQFAGRPFTPIAAPQVNLPVPPWLSQLYAAPIEPAMQALTGLLAPQDFGQIVANVGQQLGAALTPAFLSQLVQPITPVAPTVGGMPMAGALPIDLPLLRAIGGR